MEIGKTMRVMLPPAWKLGKPCGWCCHLHGNRENHAGDAATRMEIEKTMRVTPPPAWKSGEPCGWRCHPHGSRNI